MKFSLKYFAFRSAILILRSLCYVFVMFCLTTNLPDIHYNQCFEERTDHALSDPRVYQFYLYGLKITNKISFVETGLKCRIYLVCKKKYCTGLEVCKSVRVVEDREGLRHIVMTSSVVPRQPSNLVRRLN